jgi:hypothetical protein
MLTYARCAGGTESSKECEAGQYCPANSSAPLPCPEGLTSARRAAAFSDCNVCVPSFLPVQSRCVLAAVLVPAVVLPLLGAIGALVFAYVYYTKGALLSLLAFLEVQIFFFPFLHEYKRTNGFVLLYSCKQTDGQIRVQADKNLTQMPPQSGGE